MIQKIVKNPNLGKNLQDLRTQHGYTQKQISAQLEMKNLLISREMLSQMERGCYNVPVEMLDALTQIYHCDYNAFFQESHL